MRRDRRASGESVNGFGRCIFLLAVLATAIATSLLSAAPGWATSPGSNGKLAFSKDVAGRPDVFVINPDGSGETNITNDPGWDTFPRWRPDGRKLAFRRQTTLIGPNLAFVMNPDGSGATQLAPSNPAAYVNSWSPDAQKIAYQLDREDPTCPGDGPAFPELFVANADGTAEAQLTSDSGLQNYAPKWSPDGSKIAFLTGQLFNDGESCIEDTNYISVINANGTGRSFITDDFPLNLDASWSPDGTKIAFAASEHSADPASIYTINADGSGLTPLGVDGVGPVWSPDGQRIAFLGILHGQADYDIYTMNPNGSGVTRVTTSTPGAFTFDWQPVPHQSSPAPTFDHPRLASPLEVSLVPVHRPTLSQSQCSARGGTPSTHGAPLSFTSCNPPAYRPGTVGRLGLQSEASASLGAIYGDTNTANGDQANLAIRASLSDVQTLAGADYAPNPTGADATLAVQLRLTDTYNGPSQSDPATTVNFELDVPLECVSTAGPEGSNCAADTSADALSPGAIRENESMVLQVLRLRVDDAGLNATPGDSDDRIFATHGIYVP